MVGNKPILLVEMRWDGMPTAWSILNELGVAERVVRWAYADEAIAHLQENRIEKPAVILLDSFEPDENGLGLLKTLKSDERLKSIPVIVLATTDDDPAAIDECYRIGVVGYIVKSNDRRKLIDAMRAVHEYWTLSELPV